MSRQRVYNKMLAEIPWDGAELANPLSIGAISATGLTVTSTLSLPNGSVTSVMLSSGAASTNVGTLGGALGGTLPNPTLAAGVAATNVGTLGGVLGGTLPNPTMAANAVGTTQIANLAVTSGKLAAGAAATNVGTLSGVLGGTLPNPTMAAGAAATNVGTLSGVLTGTLPAPGMAAGAAATNVGTLSGVLTGTLPSPGMAANAVGTTQIQNGAVTAGKLAPGAGLVDPLTLENGLTVNAPTILESATVNGNAVAASPDVGNSLVWNINGFYVPQAVERFTAAYYYVATTTMVNPGPGNFRTNTTGAPASVTQVAINDLDDSGRDMSAVIRSLQIGDQIYAQVEDDASQWSRVTLTDLPVDQGAWWLIDVEDAGYETPVTGGSATSVTFIIGGAGGGGGGETAADTEEFLPAAAATTITLARPPIEVWMVARDGIAQSQADGHWSLVDSTLTFSEAFSGTERVIVSYAVDTIFATGLQGEQGIQGIQGEQGIQGIKGDTGDLGPTAAIHEEFMPAALATTITVSQSCQAVLLVARNGVVQSATSGNYSVAGSLLTFTDAFSGTERVVVEYAQQTATAAPPFNGSGLTDGSVTNAKLAGYPWGGTDIVDLTIGQADLADGAVTTAKLSADAAQKYLGGYLSGGSSPVYAAGAWVETAIQTTVTTSGGMVRIEAGAQLYMQGAGAYTMYAIGWDGVMQVVLGTTHEHTANYQMPISFVFYHQPVAGTRRYAIFINPQGNTTTIWNGAASWMWINEQKR